MTRFKRTLIILVILVLGLLALSMYARAIKAQRQVLAEREENANLALQLDNFAKAQVARDLAPTAPTLAPTIRRVKEAGATPVVAARVVYEKVLVPVTCPSVSTGLDDKPDTPQLSLSAEHEFALALTPKGEPWYTSRLFVDYGLGGVTGRVELPTSTTSTTVTLSKDVQDAFKMWSDRPTKFTLGIRPIRAWRVGWSAGPALVYTYDQRVTIGAAVLFGAQF